MPKFICTINTDGSGYWSARAKPVSVTHWTLGYVSEEDDYAELRIHFDTKTWDVNTDGLIYTDRQFMEELRGYLQLAGFSALAVQDICYSEQGMQDDDYVSLDAGEVFVEAIRALYPEYYEEHTGQPA